MIFRITEEFEEKVKEQDVEMVEKIKGQILLDRERPVMKRNLCAHPDQKTTDAEKSNVMEEGCSGTLEEEP